MCISSFGNGKKSGIPSTPLHRHNIFTSFSAKMSLSTKTKDMKNNPKIFIFSCDIYHHEK